MDRIALTEAPLARSFRESAGVRASPGLHGMFTNPEAGDASLGEERQKEKATMPQIIVTADCVTDRGEGAVMLRERISSSDFESVTFAARLVERLGWAVDDAHAVEQADGVDSLDPPKPDPATPDDVSDVMPAPA
jgi:hypothetical protein